MGLHVADHQFWALVLHGCRRREREREREGSLLTVGVPAMFGEKRS